MQSPTELERLITEAFSDVTPPASHEIAYREDWDHSSITQDLGKYLQSAPPDDVLENHAKSLAALMPGSFTFFLPFYMIYSIKHFDSDVSDVLLSNLYTATQAATEFWRSRVSFLKPHHFDAICAYMSFAASRSAIILEREEFDRTIDFWCRGKT